MTDHAEACRVGFLGWQCRLRQWAVREEGGRPSPGMRPDIWLSGVSQSSGQLTVLINKSEAKPVLAQFRHIVLKTHDPENRYSGALRFLGERYYQRPDSFGDELTALCQLDTLLVRALLAQQKCVLRFDAHNQTYYLPCSVRSVAEEESLYQLTYWHNRLFNSNIPASIMVLGFQPDWEKAEADPLPLAV